MKSFYELSVQARLHQRRKLNELAATPATGSNPAGAGTGTATPTAPANTAAQAPAPQQNTTFSHSQLLAKAENDWNGFYTNNKQAFQVMQDQKLLDPTLLISFSKMTDTMKEMVRKAAESENQAKTDAAKVTPTNAKAAPVLAKAAPATTAAQVTAAPGR